ncbi:MAG: hypothetical protein H6540_06445 [Bacteroidales bacterium]|nr:hypothetical protein [Bacteroidales bacterium]
MVSAFLHGASIVILIILILKAKGYFPFINKFHLHDFSRYLFYACNRLWILLVFAVYDHLVWKYPRRNNLLCHTLENRLGDPVFSGYNSELGSALLRSASIKASLWLFILVVFFLLLDNT